MPVRTSSAPTPAPRFAGRRARQATPLEPAPAARAEFPLSFGQERLWFFDQLVPRSDVYNIPVALHLRGALDAPALAAAIEDIRRRHESCRTTFKAVDDRPVQTIAPAASGSDAAASLVVVTLDDLPADERLTEAKRLAAAEAARPFDLTAGPLLRTTLLRLSPEEHVLLVTWHHIIADGWSLGIFFSELDALYAAHLDHRASPLPDLPVQYADYAVWQRQWLQGERLEEQLAFWTRRLQGAPRVLRLADRPRPARLTYGGGELGRRLPPDLAGELTALGRREGATLFMVLLAAFQALLSQYAGESDIPVLCSIANRDRPEVQGTMGFFVNLLVMRTDVGGNPTFRELLRQVRQVTVDAFAHQDVPFELIADRMEQGRDPSRAPIAQVAFAFANQAKADTRLAGLAATTLFVPRPIAKLDLTVFMRDEPTGLSAAMEYNVDLFEASTIARMLDGLEALLVAVAADPDVRFKMRPPFAREIAGRVGMAESRIEALSPLGPTQRDRLDPGTTRANGGSSLIASALVAGRGLDRERWRRAVARVARAEEACRTRLVTWRGEWLQFVDDGLTADGVTDDMSDERLRGCAQDEASEDDIPSAAAARLTLREDQACALSLITDTDGRDIATLAARRALFDRRSAARLLARVMQEYAHDDAGIADAAGAATAAVAALDAADAGDAADAAGSQFVVGTAARRSFVEAISDRLATVDTAPALDAWRARLAQVVPADSASRTPDETPRPTRQTLTIAPEELARLDTFLASRGVTRDRFVLALFGFVVSRLYDPAGDIAIHHVRDDRQPGEAAIVGCLEQVWPVVVARRDLGIGATVDAMLACIDRAASIGGADAPDAPQGLSMTAQRRLLPDHAPRFFFHLDRFDLVQTDAGARAPRVDEVWPDDEVHLVVEERGDRIVLRLEYDERMFSDAAFLERMIGCARQILSGARTMGDLSILHDDDRRRIAAANDTAVTWPGEGLFHERFAAQAARTPDAIVVSGAGTATYRELNDRADRWAVRLHAHGAGPETLVALLAPRSADFLAVMLALFKAGAGYLPIDPGQPPARHRHLLTRSGCTLAVVADDLLPELRRTLDDVDAPVDLRQRPAVLTFSELDAPADAAQDAGHRAARHGDDETTHDDVAVAGTLAYVIYTSGSTGEPKGAMLTHDGMRNHLLAKVADLQLTGADVLLQSSSPSVDVSVWQFLTALLVGGRTHIVGDDVARDPRRLMQTIDDAGVTVVEIVPSMLHAMLDELSSAARARPSLATLRWLIVNGDVLPPELCRQWLRLYPSVPIINAYGPTECSDDVTHHHIRTMEHTQVARLPVGRLLGNLRMHVLDSRLSPVPIGLPGQLFVGGVGVGRGYRNDPERTANSFIPDPFGDRPGARLYRTGDIGRLLADGSVDFLGRADHQVKVRGYRVELPEIEAALLQHDAVRQAAVVTRPDTHGALRVVACIVAAAGRTVDVETLHAFLKTRLPEYMLPSTFIALDALPLLANGKIDRRSLPVDGPGLAPAEDGYVAPRTPNEARVAAVWSQVLGTERVGIRENFFALGGHSLLATQVVSRLRHVCHVPELPLQLLFDAPTVEQLALGITQLQLEQESAESVAQLVEEIRSSRVEAV